MVRSLRKHKLCIFTLVTLNHIIILCGFLFLPHKFNIYYYNMNIYETYDDNNLKHVESGPDYGQTYTKYTNLVWNIEDSFEYECFDYFSFNQITIEPFANS